jgi:hypothetical protein
VSGAFVRPPFSDAASTVSAPPWPVATRFVPSSGSTAMSTASAAPSCRPTFSPMYSIGASSRSPSPMTMVPAMSASSMVRRIASVAAWSASSRMPRPMNRADAIAAASVTRTISSASSCSMANPPAWRGGSYGRVPEAGTRLGSMTGQWRKWRRPVNTIARWCRSATSIAISSRIEPPGWMIAVTPALAAIWIPSGNGK